MVLGLGPRDRGGLQGWQSIRFRVSDLGFRVQGSGSRVSGMWLRVACTEVQSLRSGENVGFWVLGVRVVASGSL